jgi:transposase
VAPRQHPVVNHGTELIECEDRTDDVHTVGVDETAFCTPTRRSTVFATGIILLHRGRLTDTTEERGRTCWPTGSASHPGSEGAALDPFRGYRSAISTGLTAAVRVLDIFHAVQLGFA